MTIQTRQIQYEDNGVILEGHVAWDDISNDPKPGVLVSHAWGGRTDFENEKAQNIFIFELRGFVSNKSEIKLVKI